MTELRILPLRDYKDTRILLRADLNVPMSGGLIADDTRLKRILPTLKFCVEQNAKVILISHFGRPKGNFRRDLSLAPIVDRLQTLLKDSTNVSFSLDVIGANAVQRTKDLENGNILLVENLRFYEGEEANDYEFAKSLSGLGDIYVNDAFSCCHRSHASIDAITQFMPSYAGFAIRDEIQALSSLDNSKLSSIAIIGGSKVSTKIDVLTNLVSKVEYMAIGGAMANNFLVAMGHEVGKSRIEKDYIDIAKNILLEAEKQNCEIILPQDVMVAKNHNSCFNDEFQGDAYVKKISNINQDEIILDIGFYTVSAIMVAIQNCQSILWNGPLGVAEARAFCSGTYSLIAGIAYETAYHDRISIAGGGDIISAINSMKMSNNFSYISTAGGAFLEWIEGKTLPGIAVLKDK